MLIAIGLCCRFALMPALLKGRIIRACAARVNFAVGDLCACCMILLLIAFAPTRRCYMTTIGQVA